MSKFNVVLLLQKYKILSLKGNYPNGGGMMKDMFKAILFLIVCVFVYVFLVMDFQDKIYIPFKINKSFEGIYFDFDNAELVEPVNFSIDGTLTKDLLYRPKTFKGTISIDSNIFEITEPLTFSDNDYSSSKNYFILDLDYENIPGWKLNSDYLFTHFGQRAYWTIYTDITLSNFSIVAMAPDKDGGFTSTSEIITAPCNNREDAVKVTQRLRTDGFCDN